MTMSGSSRATARSDWPEEAPFDAILAAASGSHVPQALIDQLKPGGRLVMPLGGRWSIQKLVKLTKRDDGSVDARNWARCGSCR